MIELPETIRQAIDAMGKLPGVGRKSALRHVMNLMKLETKDIMDFSKSIEGLSHINFCSSCNLFCDDDLCNICSDQKRNHQYLCVVENISDLMAIENSGNYNGIYYVLGGVLNPLAGIGPDEIKFSGLIQTISKYEVNEIILAINPSVEGDATCSFIKSQILDEIKVERIGFGVPIGGSLEYLDPLTISKAFENKKML